MSTVALTMIVKNEVEQVGSIIEQALPFFDELHIVVSDNDTFYTLGKRYTDKKIWWHYRPWNNRFDEARNYALQEVKSDFWFWLDSDDEFDFSNIPSIVKYAEENDLDQVMLPYHYASDEAGNVIAFHWRERLMRTSHPFSWKGWVHETPISDVPFSSQKLNIPVIHHGDHPEESLERNHKILEEAVAKSDDPRYAIYLGVSHHARGEHRKAIEVLTDFIPRSGSAEDIYRAYTVMSESAFFLENPQAAIEFALQAAGLIPEYPTAYHLLAQWENESENYKECLEWVKVSETKPDPAAHTVFDPTSRQRARLLAAQAEFMLKNYNSALAWLRKVDPKNENRIDLEPDFVAEAEAETFVRLLPKMSKYFRDDKSLFNALHDDMKYDARLRGLRESVTPAFTWEDNSIVILCGEGYEEWGPHTLNRGMGGSEEAVVYLSRALAKLGYKVTVYGAVSTRLKDYGVEYLPWKEFNRKDKFNVFVAWRAPQFTEYVDARVKLADIHDVLPPRVIQPYGDVTYLFKSNYHRNLYPEIVDENVKVIGNGIDKNQFKDVK